MASSLVNPNLVFAASKALIAARPAIAKVTQFSTDFSADAAQPGDTMAIHVFDTAAATDYNAATNNYGTVNGTVANVRVTFAHRVKKTYAYNPTDKLATNPSVWNKKGEAAGVAISRAIEAAVSGLVVKANIPGESVLGTVSKTALAKLRAVCDGAGADPASTVLALSPAAFAEALALFDANIYGGAEAIRNGAVPGLYGFKAVVQLGLSTDTAEKLVGALIPSEALAVAGRTIPADDMGSGAECGFTTDDDSGLTVGTYAYVDHATREHKFTMEALFGAAIIQPAACVRLVSAATA